MAILVVSQIKQSLGQNAKMCLVGKNGSFHLTVFQIQRDNNECEQKEEVISKQQVCEASKKFCSPLISLLLLQNLTNSNQKEFAPLSFLMLKIMRGKKGEERRS